MKQRRKRDSDEKENETVYDTNNLFSCTIIMLIVIAGIGCGVWALIDWIISWFS